jgi:hypothetical protein
MTVNQMNLEFSRHEYCENAQHSPPFLMQVLTQSQRHLGDCHYDM